MMQNGQRGISRRTRTSAFLRGFGGLFSWVDVLNRRLLAESAAEADAEALREVWEDVGDCLYDAMGVYSVHYKVYPVAREEVAYQTTASGEKPSAG